MTNKINCIYYPHCQFISDKKNIFYTDGSCKYNCPFYLKKINKEVNKNDKD